MCTCRRGGITPACACQGVLDPAAFAMEPKRTLARGLPASQPGLLHVAARGVYRSRYARRAMSPTPVATWQLMRRTPARRTDRPRVGRLGRGE